MRFNPRLADFGEPEDDSRRDHSAAEGEFPVGEGIELPEELELLATRLTAEAAALGCAYPPKGEEAPVPLHRFPAERFPAERFPGEALPERKHAHAGLGLAMAGGMAAVTALTVMVVWQSFSGAWRVADLAGAGPRLQPAAERSPSGGPEAESGAVEAGGAVESSRVALETPAVADPSAPVPLRQVSEERFPVWEVLTGPELEGWLDASEGETPEGGFSI